MNSTQPVQSYKKNYTIRDSYDAILIGSGIGCLTAAAMLSKEGQAVLVLERHYTIGGFTHIFKRRGYEWDVGVHYIGEVQNPKSIIRRLFDYVTDGELKWADMGEVYDKVVISEKTYDLVKGTQNLKDQLISYFPEEAEAISKYIDLVFSVAKNAKNFYLEKVMPPWLSKVTGDMMRSPYMKYAKQSTDKVLRSITNNEELIKVLSAQYGDYGLPPKQSSFAMHATVVKHYFAGGSFPVGGSAQISETMAVVIAQSGGTILTNAEVDQVIIEKNKAVGVRMKDGKEFMAKQIVSGAGINTTYRNLLPDEAIMKHNLLGQLKKVKPSVAHACLYIGLKGSPAELRLPKANYWVYPQDGSHDEIVDRFVKDIDQEFPVVYISFPAAKDPEWNNRYPGRSTIDIITLLPYQCVAQWEDSKWKKRGNEYESLKEKIALRLLEELFKLEPHLRQHIDMYELSTPITTKHFVNYEKGEIYGLDHTPERFEQKFLRPHTPIKNFYLTGQDIVTAGIGAALFSGLITASAMTKKNLMKRILNPS